jgi:hypothetical protein
MENNILSASEALYGFMGWLTTREEVSIFSANDNAGEAARLIDMFCKTNNLESPRDGWEKNFEFPKE